MQRVDLFSKSNINNLLYCSFNKNSPPYIMSNLVNMQGFIRIHCKFIRGTPNLPIFKKTSRFTWNVAYLTYFGVIHQRGENFFVWMKKKSEKCNIGKKVHLNKLPQLHDVATSRDSNILLYFLTWKERPSICKFVSVPPFTFTT